MECELCGVVEKLQTHHISYDPEITEILCQLCHQEQHEGHGVGLPIGWNPKFDESKEQFSQDWNNGLTYDELMGKFNISYGTVWRWAKLLDKPKRLEEKEILCPKCERYSSVKWGTYVNKNGSFQKYKCRKCGSTWIGEELSTQEAKLRTSEKDG